MKNWTELAVSDFLLVPSELLKQYSAEAEFNNQELSVWLPNPDFVNERVVDFCKQALREWSTHESQIITITEEILDDFFPGRKVQCADLLLWSLHLSASGGNPDPPVELKKHPNGITFLYNVAGDYSDLDYEFNEETVIELILNVNNYEIDWDEPDYDITNDFA